MDFFADSHIHMTDDDAEKSVKMLDGMADLGVTHTTIQSLPYRGVHYNIKCLYWKTHYKRMVVRTFGGLHETGRYSEIPPEKQAEKLLEAGCDGIKMMQMDALHRRDRGFGVDNAYYDRFFSLLEERNVPVCMHVADPEEHWEKRNMDAEAIARGWYFGPGSGCQSKEQLTEETLQMLRKHPRLKVTLAHFFFLSADREKAKRVLEEFPNVRFDLTPGTEMFTNFSLDPAYWHDFFETYASRLLFGTDSNNFKTCNQDLNRFVYTFLTHDQSEYTQKAYVPVTVRGLGLSEKTVRAITWDNYAELVGTTPCPVSEEKLYREAEIMLSDVKDEPEAAAARDFLARMLKE